MKIIKFHYFNITLDFQLDYKVSRSIIKKNTNKLSKDVYISHQTNISFKFYLFSNLSSIHYMLIRPYYK